MEQGGAGQGLFLVAGLATWKVETGCNEYKGLKMNKKTDCTTIPATTYATFFYPCRGGPGLRVRIFSFCAKAWFAQSQVLVKYYLCASY